MKNYTSRRFHIVVDAYGCKKELLNDRKVIKKIITDLSKLVNMSILKGPIIADGIPQNPGLTAFTIIDFSHIAIHTFTKTNEFCLNVFSCKKFNFNIVKDYIKNVFKLNDEHIYVSVVRYEQIPIERLADTFSSQDYLNDYYIDVSNENKSILNWYHKVYTEIKKKDLKLLEIGGGPTVYQFISAVNKVKEITFTDYSKENLDEIKKWKILDSKAFNWDEFVKHVIKLENKNHTEIMKRLESIRKKIKNIYKVDLNTTDKRFIGKNDIVQANFCPESATDDITEYKTMLRNIYLYLRGGGTLLMTALEGAIVYKNGPKYFPAIYLDEKLIEQYLHEAGFSEIIIEKTLADNPSECKYHGILYIKAKKM